MLKWILGLGVAAIADLYLLFVVGGAIGAWPTVALVLATAFLGVLLVRSEGLRVVRSWRAAVAAGEVPEEGLLDGLLVLAGGALLVLPGPFSDLVGVLLMLPPVRRRLAARMRLGIERGIRAGHVQVVSYQVHAAPRPGGRAEPPPLDVIDTVGETVVEPRRLPESTD